MYLLLLRFVWLAFISKKAHDGVALCRADSVDAAADAVVIVTLLCRNPCSFRELCFLNQLSRINVYITYLRIRRYTFRLKGLLHTFPNRLVIPS